MIEIKHTATMPAINAIPIFIKLKATDDSFLRRLLKRWKQLMKCVDDLLVRE
jgi:hypothetical protein